MAGLALQGHELRVASPGSSAKADGALGSLGACLTVSDVLGAVGERTRGAEVAKSSRSEGSMGRRESGPMMACMTQLGRVGRQRGPHRSEPRRKQVRGFGLSQGTRIEEASSTDMLEGALGLGLKRSEVARAAIEDGSDSDVTMSPLVKCRLVGDRAPAVRAPFGRLGLARSARARKRKRALLLNAWTAGSVLTGWGDPRDLQLVDLR